MAPSLVTIDASEPLDKIIDVVLRDGGVIVANMLSPELLKEVMGASKCQTKLPARQM
jgi:energy-converting hydrogenase Eha subunit C